MLNFHTLETLYFFGLYPTLLRSGVWWYIRVVNAGLFIFPAGVALTISYSRRKSVSGLRLRGLKIFGLGMLITGLTWVIARDEYVRFGILHFFGIAFLLAPFFIGFRYINLAVGAAVLAAGIYLSEHGIFVHVPWLLWLAPYPFSTMDYWPLVPCFGIFLLGMFCGKMLYPQGNRRFYIPEFSNPVASALMWPGRHPLLVYFGQYPVVLGILLAVYPDKILPYIKDALSYLPF